ncbi:MAG: hypothetical protein AAGI68_12245 [Planctomycetota bacterium]
MADRSSTAFWYDLRLAISRMLASGRLSEDALARAAGLRWKGGRPNVGAIKRLLQQGEPKAGLVLSWLTRLEPTEAQAELWRALGVWGAVEPGNVSVRRVLERGLSRSAVGLATGLLDAVEALDRLDTGRVACRSKLAKAVEADLDGVVAELLDVRDGLSALLGALDEVLLASRPGPAARPLPTETDREAGTRQPGAAVLSATPGTGGER